MNMTQRRLHRIVLRTATPLHIGGPTDPLLDAPVVRNAFGHWLVPGSSLTGVLRALVRAEVGEKDVATFFGSVSGDDAAASRVTVSDGELLDYDGRSTLRKAIAGEALKIPVDLRVIEDHVRLQTDLDEAPGTAADGAKFDLEVVPVGTCFAFEIECHLDRDDPISELIDRSIQRLSEGELNLGGDNAAGLGRINTVSHVARTFDFSVQSDVLAYASLDGDPTSPLPGGLTPEATPVTRLKNQTDLHGSVTIRFQTSGPLLIGGEQGPFSGDSANADMVFNRQPVVDMQDGRVTERPMIPGSGVRGLLRSRVVRTLIAAGLDPEQARLQMEGLFGSVTDGQGRRGRLRVEGAILADHSGTLLQHVAIDRLTGGSLKSALFTEAPIWVDDLEFDLTFRLDGVNDRQLALLVQAIWDIHEGVAPLGGGTRRGNGQLRIAPSPDGRHGLAIRFALRRDGKPLDDAAIDELETTILNIRLDESEAA